MIDKSQDLELTQMLIKFSKYVNSPFIDGPRKRLIKKVDNIPRMVILTFEIIAYLN